jgi:hypothetical protein
MIVSKRQIEGSVTLPVAAGPNPTSAIVIPLLPQQGSWVVTGIVQAVRADGLLAPVTYFPRITGSCANGIATVNANGNMPTEPVDGGRLQGFEPGGLSLVGTLGRGLQVEIALTGLAGLPGAAICWAWALDVLTVATP